MIHPRAVPTTYASNGHEIVFTGVHKVDEGRHNKIKAGFLDTQSNAVYEGQILDPKSLNKDGGHVPTHSHAGKSRSSGSSVNVGRKRSKRPLDASNDGSNNGSIKRKKEDMRVGYPYYKKDPKSHRRYACKGKGFDEIGKLKDHLKDVHSISEEICRVQLNFKEAKFINLKTIDRKWELVFQILFPEVSDGQIPSPYANEQDAKMESTRTLDEITLKLRIAFKKLAEKNYDDPEMILSHFDQAVKVMKDESLSPKDLRHGSLSVQRLPSPPPSSKNSPQYSTDEGYCGMSPETSKTSLYELFPSINSMECLQLNNEADAKQNRANSIQIGKTSATPVEDFQLPAEQVQPRSNTPITLAPEAQYKGQSMSCYPKISPLAQEPWYTEPHPAFSKSDYSDWFLFPELSTTDSSEHKSMFTGYEPPSHDQPDYSYNHERCEMDRKPLSPPSMCMDMQQQGNDFPNEWFVFDDYGIE